MATCVPNLSLVVVAAPWLIGMQTCSERCTEDGKVGEVEPQPGIQGWAIFLLNYTSEDLWGCLQNGAIQF